MDALAELAVELTGDARRAEELVAAARAKTADEAEQRRFVQERVAEERKAAAAAAARRIEAWKALKPKMWMVVAPVVVAFAAGLFFGGGLGLVRFGREEPQELIPNGPLLPDSFGNIGNVDWKYEDEKVFTFDVGASTQAVGVLHLESLGPVMMKVNDGPDGIYDQFEGPELVIRPSMLRPGKNQLAIINWYGGDHWPEEGASWRVSNVRLELIPLTTLDAAVLRAEAVAAYGRAKELKASGKSALRHRARGELIQSKAMLLAAETPASDPLFLELRRALGDARQRLESDCERMLGDIRNAPVHAAQMAWLELEQEFPVEDSCRAEGDKVAAERKLTK